MSLPTPNLDDRTFQDIVNEAKSRISRLAPEWTDHNVSDPGVTLIELFAWMTEMMLYRLNRVPEKSYITFMELIGLRLEPAAAARTALSFYLSAPASEPQTVPATTEVATRQTNAAEVPVVFSTDAALVMHPPGRCAFLASPDGGESFDAHPEGEFAIFSAAPRLELDALYIVATADLSAHIVALDIDCTIEGGGIDAHDPPLGYEAWCADGWHAAVCERDGTSGLNVRGRIVVRLPPNLVRRAAGRWEGFWMRIVHRSQRPNQKIYTSSPNIRAITVNTIGGTVGATQAVTIVGETLGYSDGTPNQQFRLQYHPVLPLLETHGDQVETIEVESAEIDPATQRRRWERWADAGAYGFGNSEGKPHFVLNSSAGVISFGPQVREPNGMSRQYGIIPPRGSQIRITRYRAGGGVHGNLAADKITELRRTIAYVQAVTNHEPAIGGRDAESIEHAKMRAPGEIHAVARAVTASDYEWLARQADSRVALARCLAPTTTTNGRNSVRVLLVPAAQADENGLIAPEQLEIAPGVRRNVEAYLEARRLLTARFELGAPVYVPVAATVELRLRAGADQQAVRQEAIRRLNEFLNPFAEPGFGRALHPSEVYGLLQGIAGVAYVRRVTLQRDGREFGEDVVQLREDEVIVSGAHAIECG